MTTQNAYEMMRVYLTRPGARQATATPLGPCSYEVALEGELHRCAIGCLLSPAALAQTVTFDKETADELSTDPGVWALRDFSGGIGAICQAGYNLEELDEVDGDFLEGTQAIHDNIHNWETGVFNVGALDAFAARQGLQVVTDEPQGAPREAVLV